MKRVKVEELVKQVKEQLGEYTGPKLLKFEKPMTMRLCDLDKFLYYLRPYPCSNVYAYDEFEYGDFDNRVKAVYKDILISPQFSHVNRKKIGKLPVGVTSITLQSNFWILGRDKIGTDPTNSAYSSGQTCRHIDTLEITIKGVYVISNTDMYK